LVLCDLFLILISIIYYIKYTIIEDFFQYNKLKSYQNKTTFVKLDKVVNYYQSEISQRNLSI